MQAWLQNAYSCPFWGVLGVKVGVNINSLHFYPLGMQKPVGLTSCESNNIKIGSVVWSQEVSKIWVTEKGQTKYNARVVYHLLARMPPVGRLQKCKLLFAKAHTCVQLLSGYLMCRLFRVYRLRTM